MDRREGSAMSLFLSAVTNKVDSKGRVSVPAPFRAVIAEKGVASFVSFPSFTLNAAEAMTLDKAADYAARLDQEFNPFDEDADAFAQSILASSHELPFDREGRVMLPDALIEHAGIADYATFVGLGHRFQIWDPAAYKAYAGEARMLAKERRARFGAAVKAAAGAGTAAPAERARGVLPGAAWKGER